MVENRENSDSLFFNLHKLIFVIGMIYLRRMHTVRRYITVGFEMF